MSPGALPKDYEPTIAMEDDLAKLKLRRAGLFMFSCVLDLLFKVFKLSFTNWKNVP